MLLSIHIKNLALIDDISASFNDKLNILTGETGAGKSIIMGALKIGMGAKLPKDLPRDPEKEALCQLLFSVEDESLIEALKEIDAAPTEDGEIIISRKMINGRTINTINDEAVTAAKLKAVSSLLVDMHAQHEQQTLLKKAEHLKILDKYGKAKLLTLKENVKEAYNDYICIKSELDDISMDDTERARQMEFIRYEINEIESANLSLGEDEEIEKLYHKMLHGRDITIAGDQVYAVTGYDKGNSAGNEIGRALSELRAVKDLDEDMGSLYEELQNIDALLNDFNLNLKAYMASMEFDESEFKDTESRLDVINNLKGKFGKTIQDIFDYLEKIKQEYEKLSSYEEYVGSLKERLSKQEKKLLDAAMKLSKERKLVSKQLCDEIREALKELSFMEVKFDMVFEELKEPTAHGIDDVYFVISTNVGETVRPLYDVASGGELSRIMLAIKSCMADEDNIDTLVFDEIDVGISGRAAQSVSEKLSLIAKVHQVICITHLPQIAAMADSHYLIEKRAEAGKTVTDIKKLSDEQSVQEIARLLGGAKITDAVISNAREMKEMAKNTNIS